MTVNIADEFRSISASFMSLIEGLSYIDEDVAEKLANEFSDKLVNATRDVYAEMADKISVELKKKRRKRVRRKKVETSVVSVDAVPNQSPNYYYQRETIGNEELPENPHSFFSNGPISSNDIDTTLQDTGVTNRAFNYPPGGGNSGQRPPQRRLSEDELQNR